MFNMNVIWHNAYKHANWIISVIESDPGTYLINKMWRLRDKMYRVKDYAASRELKYKKGSDE